MKNTLLIFISLLACTPLFSQITNGNINYEMRVEQWRQTCDNDGLSADDNEVRIGLNSDANTGGTATWTSGGSGASCGGNNYVRRWQADAPSTNTFGVLMYNCTNRTNVSNLFNIQKESWEEDGSPDCSSSGDACVSNNSSDYTFKSATKTPCRWWGYAGTADNADAWTVGNSSLFMRSVWRYTNGNTCGNALNFGTLTSGFTYTHTNSNRAAPGGASADKGYTNVLGNVAQDVFYQFTISTPQLVTISTNNAGTNYDTYLRLYNSDCSTEIAFDDDGGGGGSSTSVITRALCAGTYKIVVEGFSANTGDFNLSIVTSNLATFNGGTIAGIANLTTICVGEDPGTFTSTAGASGALTSAAYAYGSSTYQWERAPTNTFSSITNVGTNSDVYDPDASLTAGTYYFRRKVTDACGTVAYSNVIQVNVVADPTAPTLNVATPSSGSSVCMGGTVSATINAGTNGTGTCTDEYRYSTDGGSSWLSYSSGVSILASSSGTNQIQIQTRRDCSGPGCDGSGETFATIAQWTVVSDPSAPTLNVATPSSGSSVCMGGTVSATVNAGTNGTGTCTDEFRFSTDGGSSWNPYTSGNSIIAVSTGTNRIQIQTRRDCSGVGCDGAGEAFATIAQWTVVSDPSAPTLNVATPSSGSSVCMGGTVSATINAGTNGTGTCTDEYRYSDDGGSTWNTYTPGNSITAVSTGTNQIQVQTRRDCSGSGCDGSGETFATIAQWNVVSDPTTPAFTPTPIDVTVCVGATLSIVGGGSTGGAGTCIYEYAIDPGTGTYGAYGATNSVVASGAGLYKIKVRRNCDGSGCDISGESENSWTVVALPVAGTLNTATPINGTSICQGQNVSATINAGSGGVSGVDVHEYSTDGGSTWNAYTSGGTINTSTATTSVQIRVSRTSSAAGCTTSGPNVIVTWPVTPQPTSPTLNVATPATGTEICQGDAVNATITAGTGGTGASDVYEYSIDNGSTWNAYTSGANIVTTTASGAVKIRVSRTAGSGTGCNATSVTEIVNWPIRTSGAHVVLATSSTNGQVLPVECVYSNWTYYADPSDDDDWLIAINWDPTNVGGGHNNTARTNALVYLDVNASNIFDEKLRGSGYTDASYVSRRYWNVDLQGNTLDGPVQLRYFYALSDTSALRTQRDAKLGTLAPFHQPVSFSWFKTVGIPFTPSLINDGNNFTFSFVTLTPIGSGTENGVNYVDFTVSSFSGGTGGLGISPYPNTPLPVTYTSISAVPGNEAILVNWTTATEINNKGFEVQRSTDARNFTTIGFVNGHNNSSTAQQYVYTDTKVDVNTEYYYRLNQIDNDGKSELSNIVSAILLNTEGSVQVGNPYPNPTTQSSNIQLLSPTNGEAHISIVNSMGQVVSDKTVQINKGSNMLTVSTENIAAGIYNIHINIGGQRYYRSLSVTK